MKADLTIDVKRESRRIIDFIRECVKKAGFKKVVLGLSGGVDSATTYFLACEALSPGNVISVMMPYGDWNRKDGDDVYRLIKTVGPNSGEIISVDVKPLTEPVMEIDGDRDEIRAGNIMVRMRMIVLYDLSKKYRALVLGTENRTEYLLGYFTRYGDEASDIEPIRHLYKTQVRQMAKFLGVPEEIVRKTPSAGLWAGQTDEGELGFDYKSADEILYLYIDKGLSVREIIELGYNRDKAEKVLKRMKDNEFKHKLPYLYKFRK